jgi:hypothetical protein
LEDQGELGWRLISNTRNEDFESYFRAMMGISEKELRGEGLTEEEYAAIRFVGDTLEYLTTYYEFKWPISDRLTEEAWQTMSPLPDRPAWTGSFVVE